MYASCIGFPLYSVLLCCFLCPWRSSMCLHFFQTAFLDSYSHWSLGLPTLRCANPHSSTVFGAKVTFLMGSLLSALMTCPKKLYFSVSVVFTKRPKFFAMFSKHGCCVPTSVFFNPEHSESFGGCLFVYFPCWRHPSY